MKRKWQLALILSVLALTLYNILPTLLYYTKPLKSPLTEQQALAVADEIRERVGQLESDALAWLNSYCELLQVRPNGMTHENGVVTMAFAKTEEASKLRALLPRAGALVPFAPAQMTVLPSPNPKEVVVQRKVEVSPEFRFAPGKLALDLTPVAEAKVANVLAALKSSWHPKHPDLVRLPIVTPAEYDALPLADKALCAVAFAPLKAERTDLAAAPQTSLVLVVKGLERIARSYEETPDSPLGVTFVQDARALTDLLARKGFVATRAGDDALIFEQRHFYAPLLAATRENFQLSSDAKSAELELGTYEERILATNRIETAMHEELVQWDDDYRAAQVSVHPGARFEVPAPTKNLLWENAKLSLRKLWRGDERKILRWGLDLSGGKTVQIELRDAQNRVVTDDLAIKQGINELYQRVNGMGVSDVSIRQTGSWITLDFPGTGALSASELVKASSMHFHVVNETFGPMNPALAEPVERFLNGVWKEAVATHRVNPESLQQIAEQHLAQNLTQNKELSGLNLQENKVVLWREATGAQHPLMIVFKEHALEGANLDNIQAHYDPEKGNSLSFEVSSSARERCHTWTSQYCKERIAGTPRDFGGHGWRMAVLLNGTVISAPTLQSPLRDSASITGHFSQREVNQLVSDLRTGSMTFTPHILSEKNVSPELGQADRMKGISAAVVALLLVIGAMIAYYRFAGVVASVAVVLNLLILWAVLQNIGASLSLAGIAGVILTVGMAVDANVLVFERIKEEFAVTGRIASAIRAGYEKAFSAILDSNLTTIIAALILLNFDAGPIKAFAISMIIGIASSMFTALFLTRFYFEGWVERHPQGKLSMASWIGSTNVDFLKRARVAFATALIVIVAGGMSLWAQRSHIFGMDFTGGYALSVELQQGSAENVTHALRKAGLVESDFRVRQHDVATHLQVFVSHALEEAGKPFHAFAEGNPAPRLEWVLGALQDGGVQLTPESKQNAAMHWTAMSGQMSESMRNSALVGLAVAFVCIFAYIAVRFEYTYAMAAIGCLLHDVLITIGLMSLLALCGVPVQIDLNTIAALMTIIGYSLNDTIIIFDRVREDARAHPHRQLSAVVNHAVNTTLSRTTITSGTTLLVLLALLALGGSSMFSFALVMAIGVVVGTVSSWVIACPLMLWFQRRDERRVIA